jgi:type IV pilus assembly protein PilA
MRTTAVRVDRREAQAGFTMIELMMVVAIIAVLILIAVPTFLGASNRAQDRRAQTILHSSLVAARIGAADTGDYAWVTPTALRAEEHSVTFLDAVSPARAGSNEVSIATGLSGVNHYVIMATLSSGGKCFALLEDPTKPTTYLSLPAASCQAGSFNPASGWTTSW